MDANLPLTRRQLLRRTGLTFGAAALAALLNEDAEAVTHHPARAKHVIYLHMIGAPSQLDLFDAKPALAQWDNRPCPEEFIRGRRFAFLRGHPNLAASRFHFHRHGQSGQTLSELLPHLGSVADELCVIRSIHTDEFNHAPAQLFLHTGFGRPGRPSFGSWLSYGLGSESRDLPAYVVLVSGPLGGAGTTMWSSGFLPSMHQGVQFRGDGDPVLFLSNPAHTSRDDRRRVLDAVRGLNGAQRDVVGDPEIATRIAQYELAFRMQTSVPDLMNLAQESRATLEMYGAVPGRASFANNCLLARRLIERGVRVVELYDADWDHHADIATRLPNKCREVDRPMAALVRDLKQPPRAPAATITRTPTPCGSPAAASSPARATAPPTSSATASPRTPCTSTTSTRPSCTCSASTTSGLRSVIKGVTIG